MQSNFAAFVLTIANGMNPDFLIVEPTGVGLLSAVMQNIAKVHYDRIQILSPITIVDPLNMDAYVEEYKEIFEDQIKASTTIILSKTSKISAEALQIAKQKILQINPHAELHAKEFADYTSSFYESLLQNEWIEGDLINSTSSITAKVDNIGFTNTPLKHWKSLKAIWALL